MKKHENSNIYIYIYIYSGTFLRVQVFSLPNSLHLKQWLDY